MVTDERINGVYPPRLMIWHPRKGESDDKSRGHYKEATFSKLGVHKGVETAFYRTIKGGEEVVVLHYAAVMADYIYGRLHELLPTPAPLEDKAQGETST